MFSPVLAKQKLVFTLGLRVNICHVLKNFIQDVKIVVDLVFLDLFKTIFFRRSGFRLICLLACFGIFVVSQVLRSSALLLCIYQCKSGN